MDLNKVKEQIQMGNLELARLNDRNQPVPMQQFSQLEQSTSAVNNRSQILRRLKQLSFEEKQEWVNLKRLKANQLSKAKKWQQALNVYLQTLLGIDPSSEPSKSKEINQEQKYPVLLNIVTCQYQLKDYKGGIEICNVILKEQDGKNNIKAMYKKAHCLLASGQVEQASSLTEEMLSLKNKSKEEQDSKNITRDNIISLKRDIQRKKKDQKQVYRKIFNSKEDDGDEQQKMLGNQQQIEILDYRESFAEKCSYFFNEAYQAISSCLRRNKQSKEE